MFCSFLKLYLLKYDIAARQAQIAMIPKVIEHI